MYVSIFFMILNICFLTDIDRFLYFYLCLATCGCCHSCFCLGLDTDLSEIASMMTAPDPGAALGAKAVVAAGKNLLLFAAKLIAKSKNRSMCGEMHFLL